ncbi:hypothetical protein ACFE04_004306 [Oxalis oulophora]
MAITNCNIKEVTNKQVISSHHITGFPKEGDMHINTTTIKLKLPEEEDSKGAVLLKNLILSCDPYMRGVKAESKGRLFYSFNPGKPIIGYGVAKVVDSRHPNFRVDDLVWGPTSWEEYTVVTNERQLENLFKIEHTDVPLSYYTGIMGERFCFSDFVGGEMLDTVLPNMRALGRIAICGMISQYELEKPYAITNITNILFKKIKMQGFIVYDYYHLFPKYYDFILPHIRQGHIVYAEDVTEGLESGPNALQRLFKGNNSGKQIIVIAKD